MADVKGRDNFDKMPQVDGTDIIPSGGSTDQVLTKDSGTDYDYSWQNSQAGDSNVRTYTFFADQLQTVGTEWNITEIAPLSTDSNNASLTTARFDDTTEEGVGMIVRVPTGMTNMTIRTLVRAEGAVSGNVVFSLHRRKIPDNAAIPGWTTSSLGIRAVTSNERWQLDSDNNTLSNWTMTAGEVHQLELSRATWHVSDTLSGDATLLMVEVEFD